MTLTLTLTMMVSVIMLSMLPMFPVLFMLLIMPIVVPMNGLFPRRNRNTLRDLGIEPIYHLVPRMGLGIARGRSDQHKKQGKNEFTHKKMPGVIFEVKPILRCKYFNLVKID